MPRLFRSLGLGLLIAALASPYIAQAQSFDFETPAQLSGSPLVSGNVANFAQTTEQAHGGTQSLKFVDPAPEPFESWTYDLPFALTQGIISLWFHDTRGAAAVSGPTTAKWGGSIILEDRNNPSDFGAVEIAELPYGTGGARYYGTEGSVDRQLAADKFDSATFPLRATAFHQVVFTVGPTGSTVSVDGFTSTEIGAPGGDKVLRLRIMAGGAGNGSAPVGTPGLPPGYVANWALTAPGTEIALGSAQLWVVYDDLQFSATAPAAASHSLGFEAPGGVPDYDTLGALFPVPVDPHDNPLMHTFLNQWDVATTPTLVHGGSQAGLFTNAPESFRSIAFDLNGVPAGGEVRLRFYDALGPDIQRNKFGGSIILESGLNRAEFVAVEIWNFEYPASDDPTPGGPNYYCTVGTPGSPNGGTLISRAFGNRTVGWHEVIFTVGATSTTVTVDGTLGTNPLAGNAVITGPGLNKQPKLRLLADSATSGGFSNYVGLDELDAVYLATREPYVYYDNIFLPIPTPTPVVNAVQDWTIYE